MQYEELIKLLGTYHLEAGKVATTLFFLIQLEPNIHHAKHCPFPGNYNFWGRKEGPDASWHLTFMFQSILSNAFCQGASKKYSSSEEQKQRG